MFDVGIATKQAIYNLKSGTQPNLAGGIYEEDNGNGSLMRILPLLLYIKDKPVDERYELTKLVSSMTLGHIRSVISCFYYLKFAKLLTEQKDLFEAYKTLQTIIPAYLNSKSINPKEVALFYHLLVGDISKLKEEKIFSTGYVLHTLETSIWCLLTTQNYADAVLKAVNLGSDTDTTGAVTGGLAGILYGADSIRLSWVNQLARVDDIKDLASRLHSEFSV